MAASYVQALRQLKTLYDEGILDADEFKAEKTLLLKAGRQKIEQEATSAAPPPPPPPRARPVPKPAVPSYMRGTKASSTRATSRSARKPSSRDHVRRQLSIIYGRVDPSKLSKIPALLEQYRGREEELLDRVRRKYALGARGGAAVDRSMQSTSAYEQEVAGEFAGAPTTGLALAGKKLFLREITASHPVPKKRELAKLWRRYDYNGNDILSLAEIDKLIAESFPALNYKPALMRAYKFADADSSGFIERREFTLLIRSLVYFKTLSDKFRSIDTDDDRRIDLQEFIDGCSSLELDLGAQDAEEKLAAAERLFHEMDADGAGMVLFNEFCSFLARRKAQEMELVDD